MGKIQAYRQARRGRPKVENLAKRRSREILDVAIAVFAERGYAETDLQVVADELGLGKGTLYRYFPSKRALFLAAADRCMEMLREFVHPAIEGEADPLEKIAAAIRLYLTFFDDHPECIELIVQERAAFRDRKKPTYFVHREANLGPWKELFRGLIADKRVRDVPVDRIIDVTSDLLYGTIFTNYFTKRQKPLERHTKDILDIVMHGIVRRGEDEE